MLSRSANGDRKKSPKAEAPVRRMADGGFYFVPGRSLRRGSLHLDHQALGEVLVTGGDVHHVNPAGHVAIQVEDGVDEAVLHRDGAGADTLAHEVVDVNAHRQHTFLHRIEAQVELVAVVRVGVHAQGGTFGNEVLVARTHRCVVDGQVAHITPLGEGRPEHRGGHVDAPGSSVVLAGTHLHLVGLAVLQRVHRPVQLYEVGGHRTDRDEVLAIDAEAELVLVRTGHRACMHVVAGTPCTGGTTAQVGVARDVHQLGERAQRTHRVDLELAGRAP